MKSTYLRTIQLLLVLFMLTAVSCSKPSTPTKNNSMTISETDRFYSALSAQKGMNAAFLAMFDSAGVMLSANNLPVLGHKAISELLSQRNDSAFTLTWEPLFEKMADSGDLGYSYGTYSITDKITKSITGEGTYVTIWQKNENGEWKAVLDTGNEGLKNK